MIAKKLPKAMRIRDILLLLLLVLACSCDTAPFNEKPFHEPDRYENFDPDQVIKKFTVEPSPIDADGASRATLTVEIPKDADTRTVTFTTTAGTLVGAKEGKLEVKANSMGKAEAFLQSPLRQGSATVTASIGGVVKQEPASFQRALPEDAHVDFGAFALKASLLNEVLVTVRLTRQMGTPTPGTAVKFSATADDTTGLTFDNFRSVTTSDSNGVVTAQFSVGNTSYRGKVTVRAEVIDKKEVFDEEKIIIINPDQ